MWYLINNSIINLIRTLGIESINVVITISTDHSYSTMHNEIRIDVEEAIGVRPLHQVTERSSVRWDQTLHNQILFFS